MKYVRTLRPEPPTTWKQGRTFTIEVTEGDLLQMARLSWLHECGTEFPIGQVSLKRLHEKISEFAPDIVARAQDRTPITPEDTI